MRNAHRRKRFLPSRRDSKYSENAEDSMRRFFGGAVCTSGAGAREEAVCISAAGIEDAV